jgi:hypothetical protein
LVLFLAALADPKALGLIKTAFDEDMVKTDLVSEISVEAYYRRGGDTTLIEPDWPQKYRMLYQHHMKGPTAPAVSPSTVPSRPPIRASEPDEPMPQLVETIRNKAPKPGRNDPCWCGSGKKYKKCHLDQDVRI